LPQRLRCKKCLDLCDDGSVETTNHNPVTFKQNTIRQDDIDSSTKTLTSSTVHSSSNKYTSRSRILCCVRFTRSIIISGTPSPVIAEVGTTGTFRAKLFLS
ncbi:hypothetical protein BDP27DRAFT_1478587, partial [Rhodocollybia butyracea]